MFHQTEAKAQGWRAIVQFKDGRECLLYLGRSSTQIRDGYLEAYQDLLDDEEREQVEQIIMQRWHGAPDAGRWMQQTALRLPSPLKVARAA